MILQRHDRQHRGEPGGSHRHRLPRRQTLGQRHQPIGLDPRLLRIAAPMRLAHAPAGQHHLVAGRVARIVRRLDRSGEIDPRHMRIIAHQPAARPDAQTVLVIHRRKLDRDGHIALGQSVFRKLLNRGTGFPLVVFLDQQCLEHVPLPVSAASAPRASGSPVLARARQAGRSERAPKRAAQWGAKGSSVIRADDDRNRPEAHIGWPAPFILPSLRTCVLRCLTILKALSRAIGECDKRQHYRDFDQNPDNSRQRGTGMQTEKAYRHSDSQFKEIRRADKRTGCGDLVRHAPDESSRIGQRENTVGLDQDRHRDQQR